MDNSLKGLLLATGVIITCIVISLGFYLSRESQSTSDTASSQIIELTDEYGNIKISKYDGSITSGSEIVKLIKKNYSNIAIKVKTGASAAFTSYNYTVNADGTLTANTATVTTSPTATTYINPTGKFLGTVFKNANNVITYIEFVQQ